MKTTSLLKRSAAGFSLIELIGVMAIMAILASVITPSVLKSIERASVVSEETTLALVGEQVRQYARTNLAAPAVATWNTTLAPYAGMSAGDLLVNKRQMNRSYIIEPTTASRVLIISSMRNGLAIPSAANITNTTQFSTIWNTAPGAVPDQSSWTGWNSWSGMHDVSNSVDYLVIQRISLVSDFQSYTVTLNNPGAAVYYEIRNVANVVTKTGSVGGAAPTVAEPLRRGERCNVSKTSLATGISFSFLASDSGRTLQFDVPSTTWKAL